MPIVTSEERVGTVLAGKYRLDRILGEGGMGVVFAGLHLRLERPVAVKFLHPQFCRDSEVVARFLREARATSRLSHPNVIDVRDVDVADDGTVYMVLELLTGESLASHLEKRGPLGVHDTLAIVLPVMDALCAAHAAGIVHRDIKPDNVFLCRLADGRMVPKVLDFGIAKLIDADRHSATATGSVIGTPLYMAPEQAMGRSKDVGPASDVWSTAVMTYECLTGAPPYDLGDGPTATSVLVAVVTAEIVPITRRRPELSAMWEALAPALERPLENRIASIRVLRDRLEAANQARGAGLPLSALAPSTQRDPGMVDGAAATMIAPQTPVSPGAPVAAMPGPQHPATGPLVAGAGPVAGSRRSWRVPVIVTAVVVGGGAAALAAMTSGEPPVAAVHPVEVTHATPVGVTTPSDAGLPWLVIAPAPDVALPEAAPADEAGTSPTAGHPSPSGRHGESARPPPRAVDRAPVEVIEAPPAEAAHVEARVAPVTSTPVVDHRAGGVTADDF